MKVNSTSPINFNRVYVSTKMNTTQRRLARQVADALYFSNISEFYEEHNKDILINKQKNDGICVTLRRVDHGRIFDNNYTCWDI